MNGLNWKGSTYWQELSPTKILQAARSPLAKSRTQVRLFANGQSRYLLLNKLAPKSVKRKIKRLRDALMLGKALIKHRDLPLDGFHPLQYDVVVMAGIEFAR